MSDLSKHRVLVVDDEPDIREVIASLLNEAGYIVSTAAHGLDALFADEDDDPRRHYL
jgi:CheY-like chemotaxis protein